MGVDSLKLWRQRHDLNFLMVAAFRIFGDPAHAWDSELSHPKFMS